MGYLGTKRAAGQMVAVLGGLLCAAVTVDAGCLGHDTAGEPLAGAGGGITSMNSTTSDETRPPSGGGETAARVLALREEIRGHDRLYYNEGRSEISDAEYDLLFRELKELEEAHPELLVADSPTQRVGAPLPEGGSFEKVRHAIAMLSIESLRTGEEARDFASKVHRFLGVGEGEELLWHVEPKFDGVSAALIYVDGELRQGLTRGDGSVGEDITANLRTVRDVPLRLEGGIPPQLLEVRGEVLIARDRFERFNLWREANGYATLANARNATAGALRRNDPAEVQRYPLEFHPYAVVRAEGAELPSSHSERLSWLESIGFSAAVEDRTVKGVEQCLEYHAEMEARRDQIPFEMDGIVAKLDDVTLRERLGSNSRATKWQYAHKFEAVEATTVLRAVEIQVGVNGRLTPRAHVDPVEVLGVTVRHATLHNEDYVLTMGASPGDRVFVKRAGDVIPQIAGVAKKAEGESPAGWDEAVPESLLGDDGLRRGVIAGFGEAFAMPTHCPACGTEVVREGKYVRCPNVYGCRPQVVGRTVHMAGRGGFEIDAIGEKMIVQLFDAGHLSSPADLFALRDVADEDLVAIERWGQKTVDNLKGELDEKRRATLSRFLRSLSIPEVGGSTSRLLAKNFASLDEVRGATPEQLVEIDGIGDEVAGRICAWFQGKRNLELIEALIESGVEIIEEEQPTATGAAFAGTVSVFTGTLEAMSRFEAKAAVEAQGGRVGSSVSKKTTYLIVGGKPGSKAKKAEALGVTVLLEEAFLARLRGEPAPEGDGEGQESGSADTGAAEDGLFEGGGC